MINKLDEFLRSLQSVPRLIHELKQAIMKQKALCLISVVLSLSIVSCRSHHKRASVPSSPNAKVWICTGESSERYHAYSDCKGLSNCRTNIEEISLQEAESMGRTPCRICYKR